MKEISEMVHPEDRGYTKDHEWAMKQGDTVRIGITDYAQDQLGDVVYVEMPEVGATFAQGQQCGTLESVKAVAEMYIPISGEIVAVNTALEDSPDLVNRTPYTDGWVADVKPSNPAELEGLMSAGDYLKMVRGMKE